VAAVGCQAIRHKAKFYAAFKTLYRNFSGSIPLILILVASHCSARRRSADHQRIADTATEMA
jgi:hypothetical protein